MRGVEFYEGPPANLRNLFFLTASLQMEYGGSSAEMFQEKNGGGLG